MGMYDLDDDDDFASSYDPAKMADKQRTPFLPRADAELGLRVKRLKKGKTRKKGKCFEFTFEVTKTNNEAYVVGCNYIERYFPGASEETLEMCWRKMIPILMAATGVEPSDKGALRTFNGPTVLGEFLALSKDNDLDLDIRLSRRLEPCRPDKDGTVKWKDKDGNPTLFPEDTFRPSAA